MTIAVSIFIKQTGDTVSIASLSADDVVSKAIERMLCEQATSVIQYTQAAVECASTVKQEQP